MARRTLPRPPSERYGRRPDGGEVAPGIPPRPGGAGEVGGGDRAAWLPEATAIVVAVVATFVLVVVGGVLGSTTGLLFVAGAAGALVGLVLAGSRRPRHTIRRLAIGLALAAVACGAIGTWLIALGEGGTLGIVDYLWATTGLLVPAEAAVAALSAAWGVGAGPIRG